MFQRPSGKIDRIVVGVGRHATSFGMIARDHNIHRVS